MAHLKTLELLKQVIKIKNKKQRDEGLKNIAKRIIEESN
jgi:hypothetical protein